MCKACECKTAGKKIQYKCQCPEEDCNCSIIEFDEKPKSIPYCCGMPMKQIK